MERLVVMAAMAALLSGCGGASEPTPAQDQAAAPAAPAAPSAPSAPAAPVAAPGATATAVAMPAGDATRGRSVFNQCRACHAVEPGRNGIGPSLAGVIGREAGAVTGYVYSPANKNSHVRWDPQTMFTYLAAPAVTIPGTKMTFALRDAQQRADVIAYLQSL